MPADDVIIIACPSCSQKYRVPEHRIGSRAHCKKCGQHFRIATDAPIEEGESVIVEVRVDRVVSWGF